MAKNPNIIPVGTSFDVVGTLNQNFQAIQEAFENTLSRDGSLPNFMEADLDMNSMDILNAGLVEADDLLVGGLPLNSVVEEINQAAEDAEDAMLVALDAAESAEASKDTAAAIVGNLAGGGAGQLLRKASNSDYDYGWVTIAGTGDMTEAVYDPQGIREDAFNMDYMVDGTAKVAMTVQERAVVAGSAALDQVVRHDILQSLTPEEQETARDNIGLGALSVKDEVAVGDINATGTPGADTVLYGDGSWGASPASIAEGAAGAPYVSPRAVNISGLVSSIGTSPAVITGLSGERFIPFFTAFGADASGRTAEISHSSDGGATWSGWITIGYIAASNQNAAASIYYDRQSGVSGLIGSHEFQSISYVRNSWGSGVTSVRVRINGGTSSDNRSSISVLGWGGRY